MVQDEGRVRNEHALHRGIASCSDGWQLRQWMQRLNPGKRGAKAELGAAMDGSLDKGGKG